MASIGHVFVGVAAARFARAGQPTTGCAFGAAAVWPGLSLLPDADVVGFRLGVHYADNRGHRGATHSFVFAGLAALAVFALAGAVRLPARRTALIALAVVASHPLFDTLTNGGLGCALFWPFSHQRFFAPWRPLPVAPIGPAFLSPRGLRVAAFEAVAFLPFLIYAFWPRRSRVASPPAGSPRG